MSATASSAGRIAAPRAMDRALRAAGVAIGLGLVAYAAVRLHGFEQRLLTLEGIAVPAGDPEPFVRELAQLWHETEVTLDAGSTVVRVTRRELGGRLDVERAVRELARARGRAPIWERVGAWLAAPATDARFVREIDAERTSELVEALRARVAVEPRAVRRDGTGGAAGMTLELGGAAAAIREALATDALFVRLPVRRIDPPQRRLRSLSTALFTEVVAAHETRYGFHGEQFARATNIELAARLLEGALLDPGDELSFNERVGERTFERGFMPAPELGSGGRRTEGIGGGICQVAATLHAAAFFGGFEILEHHPHTRNSSYIEPGLDAAVSWPHKDVRIRNPHAFPVSVRASAYRGVLRVELRGHERAPRVEWSTEVLERMQRGVEVVAERNLPLGAEDVLDEGEDGSVLLRARTVHWSDGPVTETVRLRYPVVHRLVRRGPRAVGE